MGLKDGIPSLEVVSTTFSGISFIGSTVSNRFGFVSATLIGSPANTTTQLITQAGSGAIGAGSLGVVTFNTIFANTAYAFTATTRQSGASIGYNTGSLNVSGVAVYCTVPSVVFDWMAIGTV